MVLADGKGPVDKFVARLNIEHYRKKLATKGDEAQRQMLQRLLAEEEAKLAALKRKPDCVSGPARIATITRRRHPAPVGAALRASLP
jgi:hypothetical protein